MMTLPAQKIQSQKPVQALQSLREVFSRYDFFIIDLWGVVHNGNQAFPSAIEILSHLKERQKPVYFLSNAPRRKVAAIAQLVERGVPRHLYSDISTSGEETFEHLKNRPDTYYQNLGNKLYHMGPEKDKSLYTGLENDYQSSPIDEADFILNTGTLFFEDTLERYVPDLQIGIARKLPMVCANPDLVVLYDDKEAICAGRIAKEYEKMGGTVRYHGKPSPNTYNRLLDCIGAKDLTKVLMIGDSLRTDIKGAKNAHIDSLFILSGIHRLKTPEEAHALYRIYDAHPTYVMTRLS